MRHPLLGLLVYFAGRGSFTAELEAHSLVSPPRSPEGIAMPEAIKKMMKVSLIDGDTYLILGLDELNYLADFVDAEDGQIYKIEFISMTEIEIEALPEFDGF
jgi:hypothetical protein